MDIDNLSLHSVADLIKEPMQRVIRATVIDENGDTLEVPTQAQVQLHRVVTFAEEYSETEIGQLDDCSVSRLRRTIVKTAIPVDIECHECKGDGCAPCDGKGRVAPDFEECAARDDLEHCEHWYGEPGDGHLTSQHQAFHDVCCHCKGGEPFACSGCGYYKECWCDQDNGGEVPW